VTRISTAKVLPPSPAPPVVPRPGLEARLGEVLTRRLGTVVGGAGTGKSTLLGAWVTTVHSAWYTLDRRDAALTTFVLGIVDALRLRLPGLTSDISSVVEGSLGPDSNELTRAEAFATLLCEVLEDELASDLVLVLDDVQEIERGTASARLIEGLCRQAPAGLHLILSSRAEPPFAVERLRGRGQLLEIDGSMLAFSPEEVKALLAAALDGGAAELAVQLHELTNGWPAAVRLAIETLRMVSPEDRAASLDRLPQPGGPLFNYLAEEVFARESPDVRELLRTVAPLERFTVELCESLGLRTAAETLGELARRGLFLKPQGTPDGWFELSALVRELSKEHLPMADDELATLHLTVGRWFESRGWLEEALRFFGAISDHESIARVLKQHGADMLAAGGAETVIREAGSLPRQLFDARIEQLVGQGLQIRGDWEGALMCFRHAGGDDEVLPPGLAWRMGLIHNLAGELDEALAVYARGRIDGSEPADEALLLAWTASAYWLRGDAERCRELASRAFRVATNAQSDQALATAHTVLAMLAALDGDRRANDAHYLQALVAAERANDVLQIIRIRTNRGSHFLEEGSYEEALTELEIAIRLAELTGFAAFLALALTNRGEVRIYLGSLEEAIADFEAAKAIYQRMGSRSVAYSLRGLGDVYRERGDLALARAAYEEAVSLSEQSHDVQGLVPALSGLARVLSGDDPDQATRVAERALALGPGMGYCGAVLAAGWVALLRGDREQSNKLAAEAAAAARERRDRAGLAESLELHALSSSEPGFETSRLEEAIAIWRQIGNPLGETRAQLALALLAENATGRAQAARAQQRLHELGVRVRGATAAGLLASLPREVKTPVTIQSLGGFQVVRDAKPVPATEWQSKKARDLLKVLVARRGRPTSRERLTETLWPGDDPVKLANRLSVALTTVRSVLDPERRFPADHFLVADKSSVRLELRNLTVDVEHFLATVAAGFALQREERNDEALLLLRAAEELFAGDFLEEDAYEEWAMPLREEVQASYISVARALARVSASSGDHDAAVRHFLRILERDSYDEEAHLGLVSTLVAAGRHGEARRRYRTYVTRMDEIAVEAAPYPEPSAA
jgi:ATP/maltotriose-dependent transcriptional regulator MalT/DNA-binding SARP family transcriptional activator